MMKRMVYSLAAMLGVFALALAPAHRATADDETGDVEIKIQAALDATDCAAVPPTITVLGLSIDVSTAAFEGEGASSCEALVAGQPVEVQLASDIAPLVATKIDQNGDGHGEADVDVKAPLQASDATAQTITVLGLTIDVSGATLGGADDNDTEGSNQPIDLSQLMVGQFVEVNLDAGQLPALVATQLEVKNFGNGIDVEVDDPDGTEVDGVDNNGDPVDDVEVDVTETVKVQNTTPGMPKKVVKTLSFHTASNGSFTLSGLPTGKAKITVTRVKDGVTMTCTRGTRVKGNTTRSLHVRLRAAK
jgi:hypothetical protein